MYGMSRELPRRVPSVNRVWNEKVDEARRWEDRLQVEMGRYAPRVEMRRKVNINWAFIEYIAEY